VQAQARLVEQNDYILPVSFLDLRKQYKEGEEPNEAPAPLIKIDGHIVKRIVDACMENFPLIEWWWIAGLSGVQRELDPQIPILSPVLENVSRYFVGGCLKLRL